MPSWQELESRFKELLPAMGDARVDGQWGSAGEYWHVAAYFGANARKRFEALAFIAGEKLSEILENGRSPDDELLAENDPKVRWYKAIWKISGTFEHRLSGRELDDNGNAVGTIYGGTIPSIVEASITLCLELGARYPEKQSEALHNEKPKNAFRRFWEKKGEDILATVVGGLMIMFATVILTGTVKFGVHLWSIWFSRAEKQVVVETPLETPEVSKIKKKDLDALAEGTSEKTLAVNPNSATHANRETGMKKEELPKADRKKDTQQLAKLLDKKGEEKLSVEKPPETTRASAPHTLEDQALTCKCDLTLPRPKTGGECHDPPCSWLAHAAELQLANFQFGYKYVDGWGCIIQRRGPTICVCHKYRIDLPTTEALNNYRANDGYHFKQLTSGFWAYEIDS